MIKLYTFSSCTSCRKARDMLINHHIPFQEINMNVEKLSKEEIMMLLYNTTNGTTDITSRRSQDAKELQIDTDQITLNKWIDLVNEHPGLLRRPLLLTSNQLIVGYNKEEYEGLIRKNEFKKGKSDCAQAVCS